MASSIPSNAEGELRRARAELESDLRADKNRRAEELLEAYPALAADTDAALELVYTEYVVRDQMGQKPTPDEWYQRFPQWRADLEQMFEVHNELCQAENNSFSRTRTAGRAPIAMGRMPGRIAGYEIIGEVGRGGMGVVYKARQLSLNRIVALKVILSGIYAGEHERSRFRREAEAAARLDHPHIVRVYEVGEQDGRPFCAMEFVGGGTLADRLTGAPWSSTSAASLLSIVARAAHHAHERGIVHRDLKPANILISQITKSLDLQIGSKDQPTPASRESELTADDLANPKVADFGLAKSLTDETPGPTRTGDVVGTPAYMAPEQAAAKGVQIGPATDVWAVGVMLYELLTGRPPFRGETAVETLIQIREEDPVAPRQLRPQLPRDLDTICLKCLEKEPSKRFDSAAELADDLDRWLRGEPVHAHPLAWPSRFARWCRRNPRVAALSGAVAVLLLVAAVLGGIISLNLAKDRDRALAVAEQERGARQLAEEAHTREEEARKREAAARLQEEAARKLERENLEREQARVVHLHVADGVQRLEEGDVTGAALAFAVALEKEPDPAKQFIHRMRLGAVLRAGPRLVRVSSVPSRYSPSEHSLLESDALNEVGPDGHYIIDNAAILYEKVGPPDGAPCIWVSLSQDGRTAIGIDADRKARAWEINTKVMLPLPRPVSSSPYPPPFSPDGRWYVDAPVIASKKNLQIYDTSTGRQVGVTHSFNAPIEDFRFSPDGKRLLVVADYATLWNPSTGEPVGEPMKLPGKTLHTSFSPDSRWVVTSGQGPSLQVWDAATTKPAGRPLPVSGVVQSIAFSRDSRRFATASLDRTVRIWDVEPVALHSVLLAELDTVTALAFRPDGEQIATGSSAGIVRLWHTKSGRPASTTLHANGSVWRLLFSPDGRTITALGMDRKLHTWEMETQTLRPTILGSVTNNFGLGWSPDGSTLLTVGGGGAKLYDGTGKPGFVFKQSGDFIWQAEFNRTGSRVLTSGLDGAQVWDVKTGQRAFPIIPSGYTFASSFCPDGRRIATLRNDGLIQFWDAETGKSTGLAFQSFKGRPYLTINSDGTRLLLLAAPGLIRIHETATGNTVSEIKRTDFLDAAFSPNGKHLATVTSEGDLDVWEVETGKLARGSFGHHYKTPASNTTRRMEFSPDGRMVVTSGWNRCAQVWDPQTGRPISLPMRHLGEVMRASFSPDSRLVATASFDGVARVWDAVSGQPVTLPLEHDAPVRLVAFSPDSRKLITSTELGTARVWDLAPETRPVDEIDAFARLAANRRLDDRGVLVALTEEEETQLWRRLRPRVK